MKKREPLSGVDTAWLRMDHPTNLMTITGVLILEDPIDVDAFRALVEERLLGFTRFRQRVADVNGTPTWELDPHFDIDRHVRRSALPAPATQTELQERVSDLMSVPLDFSKPLWHMEVIEDYRGGSAVIVRLHHCIADGIALVQVLLSLTDEFFDPAHHELAKPGASAWNLVPSLFRPVVKGVGSAASSLVHAGQAVLREGLTMALRPRHLLKRAQQGMSVGAALTKLLLMQRDSDTVFKGDLGVAQRAAWSQPIELRAVKQIGKALDAKVNDVLLGAVAGALRHYLQARGEPVQDVALRTLIPVNLRPLEKALTLGNRFGLVFLTLPVGVANREARLMTVKQRMDEIKASAEAVTTLGILQGLGAVPLEVENQVVELFSSKASAVMTNVPGPRTKLHMKGRTLQHIMPWVPRAGKIGLGVSIFSYADDVLLGIACDAGRVPNPEGIIEGFRSEFEQLKRDYAPRETAG